MEETIAAIATAPGEGGIGIIRISGNEAISIADKIFVSRSGKDLASSSSHTLYLGTIVDPKTNEKIDEVLTSVMRKPHSYTVEDIVEINCHGGALVLAKILQIVLQNGARLAEPGEFTRRAFINGRIDLTQAEAVLDIIRSKSSAGLKTAVSQLEGKLSKKINEINNSLTEVLASIEANLDFPEEVGELTDNEFKKIYTAKDEINKLLKTWEDGRLLREGIKIAIVGRPNVGKSSLLNALLHQERAIVSNIPGTTRDTIEESLQLGGFSCRLIDTAGLRETYDSLESIGVARTKKAVNEADLILMVVDLSTGIINEDKLIFEEIKEKPFILVGNKEDIADKNNESQFLNFAGNATKIIISAHEGKGLEDLSKAVQEKVLGGRVNIRTDEPLLTRARYKVALEKANEHLEALIRAWEDNMPSDLLAIDLWSAVNYLGEITGSVAREDLLDKIFSEFCLGK